MEVDQGDALMYTCSVKRQLLAVTHDDHLDLFGQCRNTDARDAPMSVSVDVGTFIAKAKPQLLLMYTAAHTFGTSAPMHRHAWAVKIVTTLHQPRLLLTGQLQVQSWTPLEVQSAAVTSARTLHAPSHTASAHTCTCASYQHPRMIVWAPPQSIRCLLAQLLQLPALACCVPCQAQIST